MHAVAAQLLRRCCCWRYCTRFRFLQDCTGQQQCCLSTILQHIVCTIATDSFAGPVPVNRLGYLLLCCQALQDGVCHQQSLDSLRPASRSFTGQSIKPITATSCYCPGLSCWCVKRVSMLPLCLRAKTRVDLPRRQHCCNSTIKNPMC